MAHLEKYSRQDLKRVARETYRELDQDKYQNYVDPTRTDQNYSMRGFKTSAQFMRALDDRTDEIVETRMDGKPTQKPPKYASWVITCPEQLIDDQAKTKRFFQLFFEFTCERYGAENIIDMVVHLDESTPHATCYVVPECVSRKSGKWTISVATKFQRQELQTFHSDFDKVCEKEFGIAGLVVRQEDDRLDDRRDLSLMEYKREQEKKLKEAEQKAVSIVDNAQAQAAGIIEAAEIKATRIRSEAEDFEHRRMKEARYNIYFTNNKLAELREEAKKIKADTENGFGKVEDEMILSLIEEAGQRDALIMQYKRRHPLQDSDRVEKAKETAIKLARHLPDIRQITSVFPVNPDKSGIYMTDEQYDEFMS